MDDFENKNLSKSNLPEEETAAAAPDNADESPSSFEDGLVTELEGIRDLLQTELDKAEEAEQYAPGELIQELDEIDETAVDEGDREQQPKRLCECCGENECDTSFGEPGSRRRNRYVRCYDSRWACFLHFPFIGRSKFARERQARRGTHLGGDRTE